MPFPSTVPGDHALILRAVAFATHAHAERAKASVLRCPTCGQHERRYVGGPYIIHPLTVAMMVANFTMDPHVISAAALHDVIEDTDATLAEIYDLFGERIADMVELLTELNIAGENRAARKAKQRARIAEASADVQLIKAMDLLHNRDSIVKHDPNFAKVFLAEMADLVRIMTKLDPTARLMLGDA